MTLTINVGKRLTRPTLTRLMMLSSLILLIPQLMMTTMMRFMMTTMVMINNHLLHPHHLRPQSPPNPHPRNRRL